MSLEDIERLKEKLAKDPNSKLFVPLAEEYKKAGMLDEAIEVLVKGLENQPGYLSARVSLGKIFIERGMLHEAQAEFEKVITAIPDNLYAHKKLAEIYRELGEKEKAIKEFQMVLKLNPLDEWAATSLSEINRQSAEIIEEPSIEEEPVIQPASIEAPPIEGEPTFELPAIESQEQEKEPEIIYAEAELESIPDVSDLSYPIKEEKDTNMEPSENIQEDILKQWEQSEHKEEVLEPSMPEPTISEEDKDIWESHKESMKSINEAESKADLNDIWKPLYESEKELKEEQPLESKIQEPAFPSESPLYEKPREEREELKTEEQEERISYITKEPEVEDADPFIVEGRYFSAMNIYRKILEKDPENKKAMQRIEELRLLIKLAGKDKEELISKLDGFLDAIKKRRDELR